MASETVLLMIFAGIVATATGDMVTSIMSWLRLTKSKWGLVGRWLAGLPRGRLINSTLHTSPVVPGETALGWGFHYLTGIIYGIFYIALCTFAEHDPDPISAITFGAITVAAPWLILMPGMGAGVLARKTPQPLRNCLLSLLVHVSFGVGLWLGVALFNAIA